jgi:hypothetical protein
MVPITFLLLFLAVLANRVTANFAILHPNATTIVDLFEDFTIRYNVSDYSPGTDRNITLYTGPMNELPEIDLVASK